MVPGNHDIDRDAIKPGHASYFWDLLEAPEGVDDKYDRVNMFLRDGVERASFFSGLGNFCQFTHDFYGDSRLAFDHDAYYSVRSIDKDGRHIVVMGLNSAWLSLKEDDPKHQVGQQGRLLLGEQQVCDAENKALQGGPNPCLFIVLIHHPIYWLAEKDIHRVQQHLPRFCDLLLHGHLHCPSYFAQTTPDWRVHEFAAGASWKESWHAYNLVKLSLDSGFGSAIVQCQHPQLSVDWRPDTYTYHHAKNGRIRWKVKLRA